MIDISQTLAPKADQLTADDLIGGPRTITITRVSADPSSPEQPVSCFFEGDDGKPFKPCLTMRRVMVFAWGKDASLYAGRSLTLYRDGSVKFGGLVLGGVRISHMSHIDNDLVLALTQKKGKKAPVQIRRLAVAPKQAEKPVANLSPTYREPVAEADPLVVGEAKAQAKAGTDAFKTWWKDNPDYRPGLKAMLPELQELCRQGDAILAQQTADPFSAAPLPADYDPDAIAREAFAKTDADAALAGEEA